MLKTNVKPFLNIDFYYGFPCLSDLDYWLTAGMTDQQGILTPPIHLISPVVYPGVRVRHALIFAYIFFCFYFGRVGRGYKIDYGS